VTILISEEPVLSQADLPADALPQEMLVGDRTTEIVAAHLDKSHICVHTYPETHPDSGICTFRADVEVSTCGRISPLHALDFLIN
jgi:S-adenosylmethionine decarboxylase